MSIFNMLSLLGGLAMFLYGMRLMGDSLKAGSSGPLKKALETMTNNPIRAFLLGLAVTAIIQSSTATIVITAGLVTAGIISVRQSLGILVGANVGTTVTGQIIRLIDLNSSSGASNGTAILEFFKPSTLAPVALIVGIVLIMFCKFRNANTIGSIAVGFGILFSGLMQMTAAVDVLTESGALEDLLMRFSTSPVMGYLVGAGVAFVLQSSSASIGILQTFATSGQLTFRAVYAILVGIYLGDCVTTAIVIWIGAKPDARRVGITNVIFNLFKQALILIGVTVIHKLGLLDAIWDKTISSGGIANANTVFNLACAFLLLPFMSVFEKWSCVIVPDEKTAPNKYADKLESLNPAFFPTPMIALGAVRDVLVTMFDSSRDNIEKAMNMLYVYDDAVVSEIEEEEENIDMLADHTSNYLVHLSTAVRGRRYASLLEQYFNLVTEFERLGDHAVNIMETARDLHESGNELSGEALHEYSVLKDLIERILDQAKLAFGENNEEAARRIEPLEEVVDDLVAALRDNHLQRLLDGRCSVITGTSFMNMMNDIERVSDVCSNIGVGVVAHNDPEMQNQVHDYISQLHAGRDAEYNRAYHMAHDEYFQRLKRI